MKKLLTCLLALTIVLGCVTSAVAETTGPTGDPIELTFYSLTGDYNTANGEEAKKAVEEAIWNDLGINCHLNMITSDSFSDDQIAVKIAAGELDAISSNMSLPKWQTFVEKGMLLPLDDMLAEYGQDIIAQVDSKLWSPYMTDGTTYMIPIQSPVPFYCSTWLRMDLFRKYGIDNVPTTVSELIEGIRVVCENEPGMVGMAGGITAWIFGNGPLNYHRVDADGNQTLTNDAGTALEKNITPGNWMPPIFWEDAQYKETLQRYVDLYEDGILDPEIFTTTFSHADELVASNRLVCLGWGYNFQTTSDRKAGLDPEYPVEAGQEQEWVFLTNLTNDINGAPTTNRYGYETGMFVGIVSSTKYPVEVMKILNWMCASTDNYALANWGVEGTDWYYNEDGQVEFVTDDSGNRVVYGGLGGMMTNLFSDWWAPLTENYYGTEWMKIYADEPTTKTWVNCDGFINYTYTTDATTRADLTSIANEAFVNIVTGKIDLETGLSKMADDLYKAGYQEYYDDMNAQYCEGMGIN